MIRYFIVNYSCMPRDPKETNTEGMKRGKGVIESADESLQRLGAEEMDRRADMESETMRKCPELKLSFD